jgi:hypothetical protein
MFLRSRCGHFRTKNPQPNATFANCEYFWAFGFSPSQGRGEYSGIASSVCSRDHP